MLGTITSTREIRMNETSACLREAPGLEGKTERNPQAET